MKAVIPKSIQMQSRILIVLSAWAVLLAGPALADPRSETLAGVARCAGISADRDFLDCVYGAAQPMRARLGLPAAPPSQVRLVPPAAQASMPQVAASAPANARPIQNAQSGDKGLFGSIFGPSGSALRMASYTFDSHGIFTVTLSDGEVWRQSANDTNFANWGGPASDYIVTLVDPSGDAKMDVKGEPGPYSVRRLH
jgi:hypothetical protein